MRYLLLIAAFFTLCGFGPVKRYIQKAELNLERGNLRAAREYYLKALKADSLNPRANYGLGLILSELLENYEEALPYLEKAYSVPQHDSLYDLFFALAKCYQHNGEFERAVVFYNKLDGVVDLERETEFPREIEKRKQECAYAMERRNQPPDPDLYVVNAGPVINGETPEYGPVLTSSRQMIFTSKRKDHRRESLNFIDSKYYESMYVTDITDRGFSNVRRYTLPGKMMKPRYSNRHQAVVSLSQDGKKLFTFRRGGIYEIDIAELNGNVSPRRLVTTFSAKYYQNHAFLTKDGKTLYFTSDAEGGLGGLDIYRCTKSEDGGWGMPENLGEPVNTPFDEDAPYIAEDGNTMYFASKGHPGFGNYDLYVSKLRDGTWSLPENLGKPVNSPGNDIFLVSDSSGAVSYFSSGRVGGRGDMDIYRVLHLDKIRLDCKPGDEQLVTGSVHDDDTTDYANRAELSIPPNYSLMSVNWQVNGKPVEAAGLQLQHDYRSAGTHTLSFRIVAGCDTCLWPLVACNEFSNAFRRPAALDTAEPLPLTFDPATFKGELSDAHLDQLGFNRAPLLFGFDKSDLSPEAIPILDRNLAVLKKHPQLAVTLEGFTDARGPDAYNLRLSERRANSVRKYLLANGLSAAQLKGVNAKGASEFVNDCGKGRTCTEEAHRLNRRVQLKLSVRN